VLDYAHKFYTNGNSFQGFWWYKYGVRDVQAVLTSLVNRGFLKVSDLKSTLKKQTVEEIEEVLKAYGSSKVTGEKAELVQMALDKIPEDELNKRFPKRTYQLTKAGKSALEEGAYVHYIHRHSVEDLDIWSLNQLMHTQPFMPFRDKIWGYLNQRSIEHFANRRFGSYSSCRYNMSQFLREEGKWLHALSMLAEVVFYDVNGACCNCDPGFASGFFPYKNSLAATSQFIVTAIVDCQEKLGYSDDELKTALTERISKLSTPLQLFAADECVQIVFMERDEDKKGLTKLYARAKRIFKQKHPNLKV